MDKIHEHLSPQIYDALSLHGESRTVTVYLGALFGEMK